MKFRQYESSANPIREHYKNQRENQSLSYAIIQYKKPYTKKMTIWEAFDHLSSFVDVSDPDTEFPNVVHMFQAAEAARASNEPDWMQLIALLHDIGKILFLRNNVLDGQSNEMQWGITGDTFVLGVPLPDGMVYPELDYIDTCIAYKPNCGLDKVVIAYGHDEYLYRWMKQNANVLPIEAFYIARYHSLYAWHSNGAYTDIENTQDRKMKKVVQKFNKYDLYTKSSEAPDIHLLKTYYDTLIKKYFTCVDFYW